MNAETDILERADAAFAEALDEALDIREYETGMHSKRVACHTLVLARRFTANADQLRQIYWGPLPHDIGKIGIADAIYAVTRKSEASCAENANCPTSKGHES